jgi:hypothetical protein
MRYEIELSYRCFQARSTIIEADGNSEARELARAWIESVGVPLEECWVTVRHPDGHETFEPSEL